MRRTATLIVAHLVVESLGHVDAGSIRIWLHDVIYILPALRPHVTCNTIERGLRSHASLFTLTINTVCAQNVVTYF